MGKNNYKNIKTWLLYILSVVIIVFIISWGATKNNYIWQWKEIWPFIYNVETKKLGPLFTGFYLTLKITFLALIITSILGTLNAILSLFGGIIAKTFARIYIELIRNSPLLILICLFYFIVRVVLDISGFWCAVIALSLFEAAYLSEVIRSGILSIQSGQWQIAWCLGFSKRQTLQYVILPQSKAILIPPLCSLAISLLKDSALVSTIAVFELTFQARSFLANNYYPFEIWLTVAAVYLLVALLFSYIGNKLEKRLIL